MKKVESNAITPAQVTFLLIGSMIGVGILSLPSDLAVDAKQDAWIAAFIGAAYPLYMVIIASLLCKRNPKENILVLSKKCFGKFIGSILNIVFLLYFVMLVTAISFQISMVLVTLLVNFLIIPKVLLVILLLGAYTTIKGLKVLARINQLMFLNTIILCLILVAGLSKGTILNVFPIFGSGVLNILKASKQSAFSYTGIEIIFLIYPFITDKTKIMKSSIIGVLITAILYAWITFIAIYYLGIDVISKAQWSVIMVPMTLSISIINSFSFIFIITWATIMCKTTANCYFATTLILKDFFKKTKIEIIVCTIFPLLFYLAMKYNNTATRTGFLNYIIPKFTLFNIGYVTIITIIIYFKKDN